VEHFHEAGDGRIKGITWVLLAAGVLLALGGAVAFGSQMYSVKRQQAHRAEVLSFIQERGLPERFAPPVRTRPDLEVGGAAGFAVGLFLLMLGGFRAREERKRPRFSIGEDPSASYATPVDGLPGSRFDLVGAEDGRFCLRFTPAMEGRVERPGQAPSALADLARQGEARVGEAAGTWSWPITDGARCSVAYGGSRFEVRSVPRAAAVAQESWTERARAALAAPITLATFGSTAAVSAFLLLFQLQPTDHHRLETDSLSDRTHRRVRELQRSARKDPEPSKAKRPEPQKPDPNKVKQADKDKSKTRVHVASERDERRRTVSPGPAGAGATSASARPGVGRNAGMLAVLGSNRQQLANMFSRDTALSQDAEDSLAALTGITYGSGDPTDGLGPGGRSGDTRGAGGVTLSSGFWGNDKGGGGGFDNGGVPLPGSPRGPGVPDRKHGKVRVWQDPHVEVNQGIDANTIKRIIRRHIREIRYCYVSRGLAENPKLAGRLKVAFAIADNGRVLKAYVVETTLNHRPTEACIAAAVRRWRFPKTGVKTAFVRYPFHFRPSGN